MFQSYFCNNLLNIPTLLSLKLIFFFFCNMPIQVKSHFNLCRSHVNQEHVTHIFFHHIKKKLNSKYEFVSIFMQKWNLSEMFIQNTNLSEICIQKIHIFFWNIQSSFREH